MGCQLSVNESHKYEKIKLRQQLFDTIGLNETDVNKLYAIFRKFDIENQESIDIDTLLVKLDLDKNDLNKRIFRLVDEDHSGTITEFKILHSVFLSVHKLCDKLVYPYYICIINYVFFYSRVS